MKSRFGILLIHLVLASPIAHASTVSFEGDVFSEEGSVFDVTRPGEYDQDRL